MGRGGMERKDGEKEGGGGTLLQGDGKGAVFPPHPPLPHRRFSTYATIWIRSSISRCVRQDSSGGSVVVPQKVLALKDRINKCVGTEAAETRFHHQPLRAACPLCPPSSPSPPPPPPPPPPLFFSRLVSSLTPLLHPSPSTLSSPSPGTGARA